jgi:hypothetical protein
LFTWKRRKLQTLSFDLHHTNSTIPTSYTQEMTGNKRMHNNNHYKDDNTITKTRKNEGSMTTMGYRNILFIWKRHCKGRWQLIRWWHKALTKQGIA